MATIPANTVEYNQGSTGASVRTVQDRLQDFVSVKDFGAVGDGSTDDRFAIQAAVTYANSTGDYLYWPDGTYHMATDSVNNLHDVVHIGPGLITRVDSTFCPGQWLGDNASAVNRIYVNRNGNSTNDGLTPTKPISTLQGAITAICKKRNFLTCKWEIVMAPGVYATGGKIPNNIKSVFPFSIVGSDAMEHPNVPATIIGPATNASGTGIFSESCDLTVKFIRFQNLNGSVSSSGIWVNRHIIETENVHFNNCYYGVTGQSHAVLNIKGGIFENCGYLSGDTAKATGHAIRSIFLCKWEVGKQNAGDLSFGPIIRGCAGAARVQELSTGHLDWVTIEDCRSGVRLLVNSRLNISGSSFKKINNSAIYATQGSYVDSSAATIFGIGAEKNGANLSIGDSSDSSNTAFADSNSASSAAVEKVLKTYIEPIDVNHTASNIPLFDPPMKLAGGIFTAPYGVPAKAIRVKIMAVATGTNGSKSIALRLGNQPNSPYPITISQNTEGYFELEFYLVFVGTNSQKIYSRRLSQSSGAYAAYPDFGEKNIDMTVDQHLAINAFVSNSQDKITIHHVEISARGI